MGKKKKDLEKGCRAQQVPLKARPSLETQPLRGALYHKPRSNPTEAPAQVTSFGAHANASPVSISTDLLAALNFGVGSRQEPSCHYTHCPHPPANPHPPCPNIPQTFPMAPTFPQQPPTFPKCPRMIPKRPPELPRCPQPVSPRRGATPTPAAAALPVPSRAHLAPGDRPYRPVSCRVVSYRIVSCRPVLWRPVLWCPVPPPSAAALPAQAPGARGAAAGPGSLGQPLAAAGGRRQAREVLREAGREPGSPARS